jgi:hypothetical protein
MTSELSILNPFQQQSINMSCPTTATASNPTLLFDEDIGQAYGAKLESVSLSASANFQSNYSWLLVVDGVQQQQNEFAEWDATATSFDFVPTGKNIPIPSHAHIKLYAYNSNSATTAGTISIFIIADLQKTAMQFQL